MRRRARTLSRGLGGPWSAASAGAVTAARGFRERRTGENPRAPTSRSGAPAQPSAQFNKEQEPAEPEQERQPMAKQQESL